MVKITLLFNDVALLFNENSYICSAVPKGIVTLGNCVQRIRVENHHLCNLFIGWVRRSFPWLSIGNTAYKPWDVN